MPKMSELTGDPVDWVAVGAATNVDGVISIPVDSNYDAQMNSAAVDYDMTGSAFTARIFQFPALGDGKNECYAVIETDGTQSNAYCITWNNNCMSYQSIVAGVWVEQAEDVVGETVPTSDRWMRVREYGGIVYWDISPDGITWQNIHTRPVDFNMTSMRVFLGAGCYGTDTTAGTAQFDSINNPPNPPDIPGADNIENQPGMLLIEIGMALEGLGGEYEIDSPRISAASKLLGKINSEWAGNKTQAVLDLASLLTQLNALFRDHNSSGGLANAIDCAETLLGTWSGDDYV